MRINLLALAMLAYTGAATAAETTLSIPLKIGAMDSIHSQAYSCGDGEAFSVQYVNAGANALAIFPIDGEDRFFVNVVSASGARYVSGTHVWWTRGDTATLENLMNEAGIKTCHSQVSPQSE